MTVSVQLRTDVTLADGSHPVIFYVNRKKISAGENCIKDAWSKGKMKARYLNAELVNKRLTQKKAALERIIDSQPGFDIDRIRKRFADYLEKPEALDAILEKPEEIAHPQGAFYAFIDQIIDEHRVSWSKGYKKRFKSVRTKFLEFDPSFTLDRLTLDWWREFVSDCIETRENKSNTINTDAKVIQEIIKLARDKGYRLPPGLTEITWKYIEPEIQSLDWTKVLKLADMDLTDHFRATFEASRILWVIGALTGRRWGEIETMGEKNFYQDAKRRWRYKSTAKGLKPVDLPLLPEAVAFLKRIKFQIPRLAQQTVNADIKEICKLAGFKDLVLETTIVGKKVTETLVPECDTVHIHTGRHSYAMHLVDLSEDDLDGGKWISFMLGHASFSTTWKYINRRASAHDAKFDKITGRSVAKAKQV